MSVILAATMVILLKLESDPVPPLLGTLLWLPLTQSRSKVFTVALKALKIVPSPSMPSEPQLLLSLPPSSCALAR